MKLKSFLIAFVAAAAVAGAVIAVLPRLVYPHYFEYAKSISVKPAEMKGIYGKPSKDSEWRCAMCIAAAEGDWDEISRLTARDRDDRLGTYFHNLACAMQGSLADNLLKYSQSGADGLFLSVDDTSTPFSIAQSGEVWYRLGAMTMAERCTMIAMAFSPEKTGEKFLSRLAEINMIKGDSEAAEKFAGIAGCELEMTDEMSAIQEFVPTVELIHAPADYRAALKNLLRSNEANVAAYEYLMCYDLLQKNLPAFVADSDASKPHSRLYEEAALIYLTVSDSIDTEGFEHFGISEKTYEDFADYTSIRSTGSDSYQLLKEKYGDTYWFYFNFAGKNEKD